VTPCFVCGGWPESVERFDPAAGFVESVLPSGQTLVLCQGCRLEEFMAPAGWGYQLAPGEKRPINALRWVRDIEGPQLGRDKFCPVCNVRLAFAEVIAEAHKPVEPRAAVDRGLLGES
jgi:hypothetical protein